MVALIEGVVNEFPELKGEPPVAAEYQLSVDPTLAVADKVTTPGPQREPSVVVKTVGEFTITVTGEELLMAIGVPPLATKSPQEISQRKSDDDETPVAK